MVSSHPSPADAPRLSRWLLSLLLLLLGTCGFAAIWVMLAVYTDSQKSWMAVLGALDVAIILRLGAWRPGVGRMLLAVLATSAIVALANWGIIASHLGAMLGLLPWDSATRLGFNHAWTLAGLANDVADVAWLSLALLVAVLTGR